MQQETEAETVPGRPSRLQPETKAETITWMSYAELGRARGTSAASAKRYANRQRWRKQPGNDGTVRVAVPPGGTVPREAARGAVPGDGPDLSHLLTEANRRADEANKRADAALALADRLGAQFAAAGERAEIEITTLRDAVNGLRSTLAQTEVRADRAEERAIRADALVANLEADLRAKGSEITEQRVAADQARAEAREAQDTAEELRLAEEARKVRGRWARLRAAWRGE